VTSRYTGRALRASRRGHVAWTIAFAFTNTVVVAPQPSHFHVWVCVLRIVGASCGVRMVPTTQQRPRPVRAVAFATCGACQRRAAATIFKASPWAAIASAMASSASAAVALVMRPEGPLDSVASCGVSDDVLAFGVPTFLLVVSCERLTLGLAAFGWLAFALPLEGFAFVSGGVT
jgi:predicted metal-binding protein